MTHTGWAQAWWFTGRTVCKAIVTPLTVAAPLLQKSSDAGTPLLPVQITDRDWKPLPQETEQLPHGEGT
jgi:hypothetical protein